MTSVAAPVDDLPDPLSIPDPLEAYSLHPHSSLQIESTYNEFSLQ
jgi:hypothetical protein